MDDAHRLIVDTQSLMAYGLIFIALLTFLGVCIAAWVVWLTRNMGRDGREFAREGRERLEQMKRDSERLGYYLFTKLGPADTK